MNLSELKEILNSAENLDLITLEAKLRAEIADLEARNYCLEFDLNDTRKKYKETYHAFLRKDAVMEWLKIRIWLQTTAGLLIGAAIGFGVSHL